MIQAIPTYTITYKSRPIESDLLENVKSDIRSDNKDKLVNTIAACNELFDRGVKLDAELQFYKNLKPHENLITAIQDNSIGLGIAKELVAKLGHEVSSISELVRVARNYNKTNGRVTVDDIKGIISLFQATRDLKKTVQLWAIHKNLNVNILRDLIKCSSNIICVDIETNHDDIIQIGVTDLDLRTTSAYVKSKYLLNPFSQAVHGISQETLDANGISDREMIEMFEPIINSSDLIVCHNLSGDKPKLLKYFGDAMAGKNLLCSMIYTTKYVNAVDTKGRIKKPSMIELVKHCNIMHEFKQHDAAEDSLALAKCIKHICTV